MIDLHLHTIYSDGADTLKELLKKAEKKKLEYISITDHDNCNAYAELKNIDIKKYYSGKIIPGIEIKCSINGRLIEVLGYKINTDKMQEWANEFYKDKTKEVLQQKYFNMLYEKCLQMKLIMSPKEKIEFDSHTDWASLQIYKEIKKHIENKDKVPADFWETFNTFSKKYCGDKNHILYIDKSQDYPSIEEAIKAIKNAGGLVFLPHLFIYKWVDNIKEFINDLLKQYDIDGIECYHSEFNDENIEYLKNICDKEGYFISGGSDYHGINKPGIEMAIGKGNLKIKSDIIKNWANV